MRGTRACRHIDALSQRVDKAIEKTKVTCPTCGSKAGAIGPQRGTEMKRAEKARIAASPANWRRSEARKQPSGRDGQGRRDDPGRLQGGMCFRCSEMEQVWQVMDVGRRVAVAVTVPDNGSHLAGPLYQVPEEVFDEYDLPACEPAP